MTEQPQVIPRDDQGTDQVYDIELESLMDADAWCTHGDGLASVRSQHKACGAGWLHCEWHARHLLDRLANQKVDTFCDSCGAKHLRVIDVAIIPI